MSGLATGEQPTSVPTSFPSSHSVDYGPWGKYADIFVILLPVFFLLTVSLKKNGMKSSQSLPRAALVMYVICLLYFSDSPNYVHALVYSGALDALTPITIVAGAITLFETMNATECMPWMLARLKELAGGHPVAEVFLIGWSFAYMIEGASGFGTPVALAAPLLRELSHDPVKSIIAVLVFNTLATPFGAVGTPIWFGFESLELTERELVTIGFRACILTSVSSLVIPVLASSFLLTKQQIVDNIVFIYLSIASVTVPSLLISVFNYEFPSLIGGAVGLICTIVLVVYKIGLVPHDPTTPMTITTSSSRSESGDNCDEDAQHLSTVVNNNDNNNDNNTHSARIGKNVLEKTTYEYHESACRIDSKESSAVEYKELASNHYDRVDLCNDRVDLCLPGTNANRDNSGSMLCDQGTVDIGVNADSSKVTVDMDQHAGILGDELNRDTKNSSRGPMLELVGTKAEGNGGSSREEEVAMPSMGYMYVDNDQKKKHCSSSSSSSWLELCGRTFPFWGTILCLLLTRLGEIGLNKLLQRRTPALTFKLGSFGEFSVSAALVVSLADIFQEHKEWTYAILYVPFLLPFVVVSLVTMYIYRKDMASNHASAASIAKTVIDRIQGPAVALIGALVLVSLQRNAEEGKDAPAVMLGLTLSDIFDKGWIVVSGLLGMLGTFFSGSTTVSNLTFGEVQFIAAETVRLSTSGMLALQVAGSTIGNMVCLNNIVSAKAMMNVDHVSEGEFIRHTMGFAGIFWCLSTIVAIIAFFATEL